MALGGLVACSTLATAQDSTPAPDAKKGGKRGPLTIEQQMERLAPLKLTDEQKPKVEAVLKESTSNVDRSQMREKMQPIMEEQNKKMKAILTEDQFKQYQELNQRGKKGGKKKADAPAQ
jgi:Spy/CpxP family protein refolding chaperone